MAIYKGFRIFSLGGKRYRITLTRSGASLVDSYDGLKEIISIIDELTSLFER